MKGIEPLIVSDAEMTLPDVQAIREDAAIVTGLPRARIAVSGKDRASYLQGLLTNDIQALKPGTGCYAAWLTPQGRMSTDMHVLESGDMILLDVPALTREAVLQRLDQFIFTEDVQIGDLTESLRGVEVHGPKAASVVEGATAGLTGLERWLPYHNGRRDFAGSSVVVARIDQLGVPGFVVYVDAGHEAELVTALAREGASHIAHAAVTTARIEAGYPLFGVDLDEDIIPLEAGIENRAISLTKGCYVGQEVIIRVLHRGHGRVARRLVGLRLDGTVLPPRGAFVHAGDREVGFVTSSAGSMRFGAIALGYVHRDFVAPGTPVQVEWEGGKAAGVVSALPF